MRLNKYFVLFLLLLADIASAQRTQVSDFVGRWGDALIIEYTSDGFVCSISGENPTSNVAVVDSCLYIDIPKEDSSNSDVIIHTIYTCVLHQDIMEMSRHFFIENLFDPSKSTVSLKSTPVVFSKNQKASTTRIIKRGAMDPQIVSDASEFDILPPDSVSQFIGHLNYYYIYWWVDPKSDFLRSFVGNSNLISLMESANFNVKEKRASMGDYYDYLKEQGLFYRKLADASRYNLVLEKIVDSTYHATLDDRWALANSYIGLLTPSSSHEDSVRFFQKAVDAFEKMDLKESQLTTEVARILSDVPLWYDYLELEHPKIVDRINETIVDFFQKNPQKLYLGNSSFWAKYTMACLFDSCRYDDAIAFYDSIRQNFPYDDWMNSLYVYSLLQKGYYIDEDMVDVVLRSRNTAPDVELHKQVQAGLGGQLLSQGNLHFALENLRGNDSVWIDSDSASRFEMYQNLAFLFYYDKDYETAYNYFISSYGPDADSSYLMLMEGICLARMAENEQDEKHRAELQKDMANRAFHAVIEYETRHDTIAHMPYAYLELGMPHEALVSMEKQMRDLDSPDDEDFLVKAEIYAQIGEKRKAKAAIKKSLEQNHDRAVCALVRVAPYLEPIRGYVEELCSKYEAEDTTLYYRRIFDTVSTTLPFTPSHGGTIFLKCRMGNMDVDSLIFDTGAGITQISLDLARKLYADGTITEDDYMGPLTIGIADGSTVVMGEVWRVSSIWLNDIELRNVHVFVPYDAPDAPTLLGSNVFGDMTITINPRKSQLTLTRVTEKRIEQ